MASSTQGYVYLIRAGNTDKYKIGLTTKSPEQRLKQLNGKQSSEPLAMIHHIFVDDVHEIENKLHQHFNSYHHHNEWFKFSERMKSDVIEKMNSYANLSKKKALIDNDVISMFIAFVLIVITITFALSGFKKSSNPKYSECVANRGGVACGRFLKNK